MICIPENTFYMSIFVVVCIIGIIGYNLRKEGFTEVDLYSGLSKDDLIKKIMDIQSMLQMSILQGQDCQRQVVALQQQNQQGDGTVMNRFLNKIRNPLAPPENVNAGGTLYSRGYDAFQEYQMIGYLSNNAGQYPVYGRHHDPGRSDRWDYYTINESRNRIKIPFKTKNYVELYDGDTVDIPEIGMGLVFKKYETEGLRYNPNI